MRKGLLLVVAIVLLSLLLISACAQQAPAPKPNTPTPVPTPAPPPAPAQKVRIVVTGGPAGGGQQLQAEAIGEAIRRGVPNSDVTVIVGGVSENIVRISNGEAQIGTTEIPVARQALKGEGQFGKPQAFKALSSRAWEPFTFIAMAKTGLTSIQEIIDKKYPLKVAIGKPGSGANMVLTDVFGALGITLDQFDKWGGKTHAVMQADALNLMADGLSEAAGGMWGMPGAAVTEFSNKRDVKWLPLSEATVSNLEKIGYQRLVVKPGKDTYAFVKQDVLTVKLPDVIIVPADMSVDMAYTLIKAIFSQKDFLATADASFNKITPESAAEMDKTIPLHEGAKKYLREVGAIK